MNAGRTVYLILYTFVLITVFSIKNSTIFALIWIIGLVAWFFLEIANSSANFFNLKHTSQYLEKKYIDMLASFTKLKYNSIQNNNKLQIIYKVIL